LPNGERTIPKSMPSRFVEAWNNKE
jgi:hypothetical protein